MEFLTESPELLLVLAALAAGLIGGLGVARRRKHEDTDTATRPRRKRDTLELPVEDGPAPGDTAVDVLEPEAVPDTPEALVEPPTLTPRERFRQRLSRTRNVLGASVADLFGRGVTDEAWDGLEEALITADVGVTATTEIVEDLKRRSREEGATSPEAVVEMLKQELRAALGSADRSLARATDDGPTVWLVTGVNGTGKTTTIGKLAAIEQREGRAIVLAAADTFRAAAADQLDIWAQRTGAHLVRKDEGADPASVAFESYVAAAERNADLLIVDTAGRLHNKRELMDELGKVKRVLEKQAGPLEETLLVLDATTGQNGISQARAFLEAVEVTGIALTKLDGSSKGGIVVAVQRELGLPVKLVGLGEDIDDLAPFDPDLFVDGLFATL
ncbi:MAG TPA: signal recognition particle-docking protein FtsY [Egicoccus sp.]|nr:signal recognition particle-docking protein FtsY [Egicoccus sp.]HSK24206.1 signal recognition particle-docking protein FtsY [Egicoccus sp.]